LGDEKGDESCVEGVFTARVVFGGTKGAEKKCGPKEWSWARAACLVTPWSDTGVYGSLCAFWNGAVEGRNHIKSARRIRKKWIAAATMGC